MRENTRDYPCFARGASNVFTARTFLILPTYNPFSLPLIHIDMTEEEQEEEGVQMESFETPSESLIGDWTGPGYDKSLDHSHLPIDVDGQSGRDDRDQTGNEADLEPGRQLEPAEEGKEAAQLHQKHFILLADEPQTSGFRLLRHFSILGLLSFSSIWGVLAREGLIALNTYDGMSVSATIWPQAVGCLIIGYVVANRVLLERWYPPIYIALGTGFCGSLTTFSTFILQVFQAYSNQIHFKRHGLQNVMDALSQTALTFGMSLTALSLGGALKEVFPLQYLLHHFERLTVHKSILRHQDRRLTAEEMGKVIDVDTRLPYTTTADAFNASIGFFFWIATAVLCGMYPPFRHVTYAVVMGPPGTFLRWYLSRLNSSKWSRTFPHWPVGTLTANLLATLILCFAFIGQNFGRNDHLNARGWHPSSEACNALHGVQEGFCGCLSTISTFAVELSNIRPRKYALGYAAGSYILGIVVCVIVIGIPWWTIGMEGSCSARYI